MSELPSADVRVTISGLERPLVCRACAHPITSSSEAIEVGGSHQHTRLNPVGVLFRFGCFRHAPGRRISGEPTAEHAWFTGCLWQYAHCGNCRAHLGWAFSGADAFFGLVLERLSEAP